MTSEYDLAQNPGAAVADLLQHTNRELARYVVLDDMQRVAISLWVFHTHTIASADTTPYLAIYSAQKESGKTRLLEVLELLVARAAPAVNVSDSALFRLVDAEQPTILFDEIDTIFGPKARDREDLRGMLNGGYRRGARVWRMTGPRMTTLQTFNVFGAKALAGIGAPPDTIASRSIPILLKRRASHEEIERFRRRHAGPGLEVLHDAIEAVSDMLIMRLADAEPDLPEALTDRQQDAWEPLFAIADMAGENFGKVARFAAVRLLGARDVEDDSLGILLLHDIRQLLVGSDRIFTRELLDGLCTLNESPWGSFTRDGKSMSERSLAKLLRPFGIRSRNVLIGGIQAKGYLDDQFQDAFLRYLPVPEPSERPNPAVEPETDDSIRPDDPPVDGWESQQTRMDTEDGQMDGWDT